MPTDFSSTPAVSNGQRFLTGVVRAYHAYANWLVGISWKRFFMLAVLLMIVASIVQSLPPFASKVIEIRELNDGPTPPTAPKPPVALRVPGGVTIDKSGVRIEPGSGSKNDVTILIDKDGVRITPRSRAASAPLAPAAPPGASPAGSGATTATTTGDWSAPSGSASTSTPASASADGSVHIDLPPGATSEAVKRAVEQARDAVVEAIEESRQAAAEAASDAAEAAKEGAQTKRNRKTKVIVSSDPLESLAFLFIVASAILKISYKGRVQAEVKAAAATETAESEQLKRQVVEARMAAMQAQVEPHFLFNTLASIDHLIETDPARASQMQKNLIALLRASMPAMRENHPAAHNLGREIAVIRPYLEILKVRMEERLQTVVDVPEGLLSAEFPSMMIQSLVENAIKHGLEPKSEGGTLTVRAEVQHGKLAVTVADTGVGFGNAATAGTGVGLANIRERLQLLYGGKASMLVAANTPSGTVVTLTVPYQAQAREGEGA